MLDVTCAIIAREGRVLVTQRSLLMSLPLQWEFPGGKVEYGETARQCIVRELAEELGLRTEIVAGAPAVTYPAENPHLRLLPFVVRITGGELSLLEHADAKWCLPGELPGLDWAEADLQVLDWWMQHHARFRALR